MPGTKRKPGAPKGVGGSPARRTPPYGAIAAMKADFASLLPIWAQEKRIHSGALANQMINLHVAFCEWLDEKEPGQGEICRKIFRPKTWVRYFKMAFPRVKTAGARNRHVAMLRYVLMPKNPPVGRRYGVCPMCQLSCVIDDNTQKPADTGVLIDALTALNNDAIADVGLQKASRPTTSQHPYNHVVSDETES